jgi:hypothetical protein
VLSFSTGARVQIRPVFTDRTYGKVTVAGDPLDAYAAGNSNSGRGHPAPTITGRTFNGAKVTIEPGTKPIIVVFVDPSIPAAQSTIDAIGHWWNYCDPATRHALSEYLDLRAVSTQDGPPGAATSAGEWLHEMQWTVPTIVDDDHRTAATAYGIAGASAVALIDTNGLLLARFGGSITETMWSQLVHAALTENAS